MRHGKKRSKLSVMPSHRKAMLRNMVRSLIRYQKIETTLARAKEARRLAEHLITLSKTDTVFSRRLAYSILADRDLVAKLFNELSPLFKTRNSGYTRIIPSYFRRGDGANMVLLEFTEKKIIEKVFNKKKEKQKAEAQKMEGAKKHSSVESVDETKKSEREAKPKEEHKKEEPRAKVIPKSKPTLAEEKRTERAKNEDKKMDDKKKFLKNLRGFFHRKSDM